MYNKKDNYYKITNKIANNKENFYDLLSPNDCEDLLYFYLYYKYRYVAIPSTNKINTQNYEFEEIGSTKNNKKIYAINPEVLYEFAKKAYEDESILMPQSILQWFEYLE